MYNRTVALAAVVVLIAAAIFYIDSHKVGRGSSGALAAEVAPASLAGSSDTSLPLAHEITDATGFINTPPDSTGQPGPIKVADYVGKDVVLLDFWTYSCINCERTLPYLEAWYQKYKDYGLVIIGIHTPEFDFEKVYDNVVAGVRKYGITYPVVLDSNYGTWNAYGNQYWPAEYLVNIDGRVADHNIGEGDYAAREAEIQKVLQERADALHTGQTIPTGTVDPSNAVAEINPQSPETYFGSARNEYIGNGPVGKAGVQTFTAPAAALSPNTFYFGGSWDVESEFATSKSAGATISYPYTARAVYFVASAEATTTVDVYQDGRQVGTVEVKRAGLYTLIQNPSLESHTLMLKAETPGLEAFTFTFG